MRYDCIFEIMVSHIANYLYCRGQGCPLKYKMYGNRDFKNAISPDMYEKSL